LELGEVGREAVTEVVVGDIHILELRKCGDLSRHRASEVVAIQRDGHQVSEAAQFG